MGARIRILWDHPRSRGVYGQLIRAPTDETGSSPLARGLRSKCGSTTDSTRIIPARAGFTRSVTSHEFSLRDHPRSRGVYVDDMLQRLLEPGSSPLARGLPGDHITGWWEAGIIPARAGFTPGRGPPRARLGDHPRSRGVYTAMTSCGPTTSGSSPLARGLRCAEPDPLCRRGIIPARAGFTR